MDAGGHFWHIQPQREVAFGTVMKQGANTVIGLLTFLLLATFGAAAYFVSKAYSAQKSQIMTARLFDEQKIKAAEQNTITVELKRVVSQLQLECQSAVTRSQNAMGQLDQFRGLIDDQGEEIEYLLGNLQSMSNQLAAAVVVENNLNRRLGQLDKEKREAIEVAAGLRDKLSALEKEFDLARAADAEVVPPMKSPESVAGLPLVEVKARLKELESLKAGNAAGPTTPASGTVRGISPEFGFVILDIGAPDEVKPGDEFIVSRGIERLGRLRVRKLHSGLCICDVIEDHATLTIAMGDQVKQVK